MKFNRQSTRKLATSTASPYRCAILRLAMHGAALRRHAAQGRLTKRFDLAKNFSGEDSASFVNGKSSCLHKL